MSKVKNNLLLVKQLFDQCIDADAAQREAILASAKCSIDELNEVQRLLALADEEEGQDSLQQAIINRQMSDMGQQIDNGQQLDAWQVGAEIGRGGMGIVFEAHRADGQYQQKAALKITPAFASSEELKRFHLERQILAQLQHPNIAMLLDGGSTEDNRPYLVMEFVAGLTLIEYANHHQLGLNARLALFAAVCQAVQFAHDHDVIHRDLKPENVLVTDQGQVKLLDFGISKMIKSDNATQLTMAQGLTLAYASPEQVKGERTTVATDIYSLGALLYELLCGQSPHKIDSTNPEQAIVSICRDEPVNPSVVCKGEQHVLPASAVAVDLDNICSKSLRKEPENRYFSVIDLQRDIENFLAGKPVLATPPRWRYRVGKFIRRHPVSSGLTAALSIAVIAGLSVSLNLTWQLTQERDQLLQTQNELQKEVDTSSEVIRLLTGMFKSASPNNAQGKTVSVQKLVDTAVEQTEQRLNDRPKVKARLYRTLAFVQQMLGNYEPGVTLYEQAQQLDGSTKPYDIALLAEGYRKARKLDKAAELLKGIEGVRADNGFERAEIARIFGEQYRESGSPEKALPYFQQVYDYYQDNRDEKNMYYFSSIMNLAIVHSEMGDHNTGLKLSLQGEQVVLELFGKQHPRYIRVQNWLSHVYRSIGHLDEAGKRSLLAYQAAGNIYDHNNRFYSEIVTNLAYFYHARGQYQQAAKLLQGEIVKEFENPSIKAFHLSDIGAMLVALGRYDEALEAINQAEVILQPLYKGHIAYFNNIYLYKALAAGLTGDRQTADDNLNVAKEKALKAWGKDHLYHAMLASAEMKIKLSNGEFDDFETNMQQVTDQFGQFLPLDNEGFLSVYEIWIEYYLTQKNWPQAQKYIEKSIKIANLTWAKEGAAMIKLQMHLGQVQWHLGIQGGGELMAEKAEQLQQVVGENSAYYKLANSLLALL